MTETADTSLEPVRWGILATGKIARTFADDLLQVPDARLVAVGSRRTEAAEEFARAYASGGPVRAHGSYEDLVADPEVDVVYIASPHALHLEHARLALEAGKHVLCEKALTLDLADAEEMVALARKHGRFLMEAMWSACHPTLRALKKGLAEGTYGRPRLYHAELGFVVGQEASERMREPALGASALLDMGIYPLTVAHLLFGEARSLTAQAEVREAGGGAYDVSIVMTGSYDDGVLATMNSSMSSWSSRACSIATDRGRIELENFHHPTRATFTEYAAGSTNDVTGTAPVVEIVGEEPVIGRGYGNEIVEVDRCLREGLRESPLVPHEQTLTLMRQMDEIRRTVGIRFPGEG